MNDDLKNEDEVQDVQEDVISDEGEGEDTGMDIEKIKEKLAKVKIDLKDSEREKREYLDGWQRSKADYINYKREVGEREKEERLRAVERVMRDLLPVLESMDKARNWVKDLAPIENQMLAIMKDYGLEQFGKVGEAFDPSMHEAVGTAEVDDKAKENIICELVSAGYKLGSKIIKPAKVKIYG